MYRLLAARSAGSGSFCRQQLAHLRSREHSRRERVHQRAVRNWQKAHVAVARKVTTDMLGTQRKCALASVCPCTVAAEARCVAVAGTLGPLRRSCRLLHQTALLVPDCAHVLSRYSSAQLLAGCDAFDDDGILGTEFRVS